MTYLKCCDVGKLFCEHHLFAPRLGEDGYIHGEMSFDPHHFEEALHNVPPVAFCPWCGERVKDES